MLLAMKALLHETKRRVVICETFCGILRFLSFLEFLIGLLTKEISSYLKRSSSGFRAFWAVVWHQSFVDKFIFELIKVILILMAYKPDGTRQTEALFIISRTIIAFNPLGSVSSFWYSLGHQRTSRTGWQSLFIMRLILGTLMRLKSECFMLCNYKV